MTTGSSEGKDFIIKGDGKGDGATEKTADAAEQLPEMNFATFIFSLNSSALVHLGVLADPTTGKTEKKLAVAKQTIDILGMLEEKTKGNLTEEEGNMLQNILQELRLKYIKEKGD
ncbi:MAG: DUF1844 domain-containing protein [Thermodesulfobacteriota bacterium]|nr:DUF1844 domain-containing protein [Thermodesulfobacteriota bacterium]